MTRGNQRDKAREKNQAKVNQSGKGQRKDEMTPLQRKEHDIKMMEEKLKKKAEAAAAAGGGGGGSGSGGDSKKK